MAACDRVEAIFHTAMNKHDPPLAPRMSEVCSRGQAILDMLQKHTDRFDLRQANDHGDEVILRVHSVMLYKVLQNAYPRFEELTKQSGQPLIADTFSLGIMREEGLRHLEDIFETPGSDFANALGMFMSDATTPMTKGTFEAAYWSAQCAVDAVKGLLSNANEAKLAYALCRPPGHHASHDIAGGFCFFNNIAVAAQEVVAQGKRPAILDVDFHHGNGTQAIFYERNDVLFVSIHCDPRFEYPFWAGFEDEVGRGKGTGFNLNIPLPPGTTGSEFLKALCECALPKIQTFDPDILLISLGTDTARADPEGQFLLDTNDFQSSGHSIRKQFPSLPCVVVQEGGYGVDVLANNVYAFLSGLQGTSSI